MRQFDIRQNNNHLIGNFHALYLVIAMHKQSSYVRQYILRQINKLMQILYIQRITHVVATYITHY